MCSSDMLGVLNACLPVWLLAHAQALVLAPCLGMLLPVAGAGGLDDAVGAFVRLLQDAPPLQRGDSADPGAPAGQMTLAEGLEHLARIRAQLPAF